MSAGGILPVIAGDYVLTAPSQILFFYLEKPTLTPRPPFSPSELSVWPERHPNNRRNWLLEIEANQAGDCLRIDFNYSDALLDTQQMERLAERCHARLENLIDHCLATEDLCYTPSDFPLAQIGQETLDRLVGSYADMVDIYRLSPMQEGMLFHTVADASAQAYLRQTHFRIEGSFDFEHFKRALDLLIQRHAVLRSSFHWQDLDHPLQLEHESGQQIWHREDWRDLDEAEAVRRRDVFLETDWSRGMDLAQAPAMRFALFELAEDKRIFVWTYHHLLLDGWSLPRVFEELFTCYEAYQRGDEPDLPQVAPFRDYIAWLTGRDLTAAEPFWRRNLAGFSTPTPLPGSEARGTGAGNHRTSHAVARLALTPEASAALARLASKQHLTVNTLIQGAWSLLLARYSGETEVCFGSTVSGRPAELAGVESMVGMFLNTLPVRVTVADRQSLSEWLRTLLAAQVARDRYAFTPLARIQKWSGVTAGVALFETLLVFENLPVERVLQERSGPLQIEGTGWAGHDNYPLTLVSYPRPMLQLEIIYDTGLFQSQAVGRLLTHMETLLENMAIRPQAELGRLPMLGQAERTRLLVTWNKPHKAEAGCLHQRFAQRARLLPDHTALTLGGSDQQLSYADLDARAEHLANYLAGLGVGPEVLVGLACERSLDLVIGLLAILKAGGAYLPLDIDIPADRFNFILTDSGAALLLTQSHLADRLAAAAAPLYCFDSEGHISERREDEWQVLPETPPTVRLEPDPDNLAYVIYTSGSTGRPKGTQVTHANATRLFTATEHWFRFDENDVWTLFHSFAFDFSVWEIWGALLYGGKLVVVPYLVSREPAAFYQLLADEGVTILNQTPSAFAQLMRAESENQQPVTLGLRYVIFGGEALETQQSQALVSNATVYTGPVLVNMYGITETTVHVTYHPLRPDDRPASPIGVRIPDLTLYVLGPDLRPAPAGVRGEMYVGGAGVARGYLNRPALTAQRFIPSPYGDAPGSRLYRSGDLARFDEDGILEFIGRADFQVKIRGFRIELGEIEALLATYPGAGRVVVLHDATAGRLIAYLEMPTQNRPATGELRAFLAESLPDYMVPAAFVILDAMPLTQSGKINRKQLPSPDEASQTRSTMAFAAPRNETEHQLAEIWSRSLNLRRVGIHDNFYELGGDSIISIQVIARAKQAGLQLTLNQIFENQTIASLAEVAGHGSSGAAEQGLVTGSGPPAPIQQRFFATEQPVPHHYNQALLLEVPASVEAPHLEEAVAVLLHHHDALRARFVQEPDGWSVHYPEPNGEVPFQVIDLSHFSSEARREAIETTCARLQASLDLATGPILRTALLQLGSESRLLIVIHHLAVDGVSWRVLLDDLQTAYAQLSEGEPVSLPAKTTSFKEYAARLARFATSPRLAAEAEYWLALPPLEPLFDGQSQVAEAQTIAQAATFSLQTGRDLHRGTPAPRPREPTTPRSTTCC